MHLALLLLLASLGGRSLPNATVTVTGDALPRPRVTTTAANGAWSVPDLPAGAYNVTFSLSGHQTLTRQVEVRAGEQTRVDGTPEPSDEGESVTLTAGPRSVHERPQRVYTITRETIDALPLGRRLGDVLSLAPGQGAEVARVDSIFTNRTVRLPVDAVERASVIFSGAAADLGWFERGLVDVTTRGGRALTASARETIEWRDGDHANEHEITIGGLWMFAAARSDDELHSAFGKATVAPTAHDTVSGALLASNARGAELFGATWTHARERFTAGANVSNDFVALRGSTFLGGRHELAAGAETFDDEHAFFLRDRFQFSERFIVEGGLRHEDDELLPRAGVVFDPTGAGESRIAATFARFRNGVDEAALSYARQLGSSGYARTTLARRENATLAILDGEIHWLLFTFGATAVINDRTSDSAAAWIIASPPLPGHRITVALLERYRDGIATTDLGFHYAYPRDRFSLFAELDAVNVFDRNNGRLFRLSAGIRL